MSDPEKKTFPNAKLLEAVEQKMKQGGLSEDEQRALLRNSAHLAHDLIHAVAMLKATMEVIKMPPVGLPPDGAGFLVQALDEGIKGLGSYQTITLMANCAKQAEDSLSKATGRAAH